jgi:predicted RNA binding protein YcfA (HicA-like mRNA interferase family)
VKFTELVRVLEEGGFKIVKQKGSIKYYGKPEWNKLIRVDSPFDGSNLHLLGGKTLV